jgi:hypothetical protein
MTARYACLPLALLTLAAPAAAQEVVETPVGPARIEGEAFADGGLRLMIGERELLRTEEDAHLWVEEVVGDRLLVGLVSGGTACAAMWRWVDARTGEASESFGTCSSGASVMAAKDGKIVVTMGSQDFDHPSVDYVFDGVTVTEVPRDQVPSDLPPGTPGEAWAGRWSHEFWIASDWREVLRPLMGQEAYDMAQATFTQSHVMEPEGDWMVGTGCVRNACDIIEGVIAVHRRDGHVVVALSNEGSYGYQSWVWGQGEEPLPPTMADMLWGDEGMP